MEISARVRSLPLTSLPDTTKRVLSDLLNSTKVIPTDEGLIRMRRDWCGLASLANISAELSASIQEHPDKTARVLELWSRDHNATLGELLDNLQTLDRYDVYDDVLEDLNKYSKTLNNGVIANNAPMKIPPIVINEVRDDSEILTYDDRPGYKHHYHAFVLYADEDQTFVDKLTSYLSSRGIEVCTKDKLIPGHATQYAPISKLISERCQRIILVYSPEFLDSPANTFFMNYAQAISIDSRRNSTLPIMYRACTLPPHLALYHMLRYDSGLYNFWEKLTHSINISIMPRSPHLQAQSAPVYTHSSLDIGELPHTDSLFVDSIDVDRIARSSSEGRLASSSPEGSVTSDTKKKKSGLLKNFYRKVTGKKDKAIMVPC